MRPYFIIMLCASLLLQSCTSMYGVTEPEGFEAIRKGDSNLEIVLKNSSRLRAEKNRYILVDEPGDFYFGSGRLVINGKLTFRWLRGTIPAVRVTQDTTDGDNRRIICWQNDTTAVRFSAGEYVRVSPELGTGLYLCGLGKPIPVEDIAEVEVEKINPITTTAVVLGSLTAVLMSAFVIALDNMEYSFEFHDYGR